MLMKLSFEFVVASSVVVKRIYRGGTPRVIASHDRLGLSRLIAKINEKRKSWACKGLV
jgi:hypothetical protein